MNKEASQFTRNRIATFVFALFLFTVSKYFLYFVSLKADLTCWKLLGHSCREGLTLFVRICCAFERAKMRNFNLL